MCTANASLNLQTKIDLSREISAEISSCPQIRFKNNCNCVVDYKLLSDAIHHTFPTFRHKKVQKRSISVSGARRQPAISMKAKGKKNKMYPVSRLLCQYLWPDSMTPETVVHHKDNNPFNNLVGNLKVISAGKHSIHHNKGKKRPQWQFDKNEVISLYKKGWSLGAIARRYGCSDTTIRTRLVDWGIIQPDSEQKEKRPTPLGIWRQSKVKIQHVAEKHKMTMCQVVDKLANHAMTKEFQDDLQ